MRLLARRAPMPLLTKELTEQAARRRTYAIRVLYAALFFAAFFLIFYQRLSAAAGNPLALIGYGRDIFQAIAYMQFAGIYIFLPAMMAGVVTAEKERDSLSLLLVTRLRPWEIVLQKYFSRLIPMFSFLLLGLPLLAVAYAYGGVSTDQLITTAYLLVLTCLQVGAWSLMLSSFCRGTIEALVGSYLFGFVLYYGPAVLEGLYKSVFLQYSAQHPGTRQLLMPLSFFADGSSITEVLVRSLPAVASIGVFLVMARVLLVRRAFLPPTHFALRVFGALDAFWHRANRLVGGIILLKEPNTLPHQLPVAWREIRKRSAGKASHLFRMLLLMELPLVLVLLVYISNNMRSYRSAGNMAPLSYIVWGLSALVLVAKGAGTFSSERASRTMDVLLTTPITGASIVRQKARGMSRTAAMLAVPVTTVILGQCFLSGFSEVLCPVGDLVTMAVYFPLFCWMSIWISLKTRSRARAIIAALGGLVAWCLVPVAIIWAVWVLTGMEPRGPWAFAWLTSPASIIVAFHSDTVFGGANIWALLALNTLWYGAITWRLRALCLKQADRYLGRIDPRQPSPPAGLPAEAARAGEGA